MSKYKYYFKKPKSEITKDIFLTLLAAGAVAIAATSPYFGVNLVRSLLDGKNYKKKRVYDTFSRLRKQGYLEIRYKNEQMYVYLTEKGKKKAGRLQINDLKISKPKRWDKFWRIVAFDISQRKRPAREALRGKLKELGFYALQDSVWIHPYKCEDEIKVLQEFFGLSGRELQFIQAKDIWFDHNLREIFKIS